MGKYTPLTNYLKRTPQGNITLKFSQIEKIIAPEALPISARKYRNGLFNLRWWDNFPGASEADARLDAGFQVVMVDFESEQVKLKRIKGVKRGAAPH